MATLALIGRVFPAFPSTTGRYMLVADSFRPPMVDDNLDPSGHPSGKVHAPWVDTVFPLAESALLEEETP